MSEQAVQRALEVKRRHENELLGHPNVVAVGLVSAPAPDNLLMKCASSSQSSVNSPPPHCSAVKLCPPRSKVCRLTSSKPASSARYNAAARPASPRQPRWARSCKRWDALPAVRRLRHDDNSEPYSKRARRLASAAGHGVNKSLQVC